MCFNAAASFAASAVLVPAGLHTLRIARAAGPRWLPLAAFPLLFGLLICVSVVVSAVAYGYAFVSVWCFFAALLSAWLGVRLPERLGEQAAAGEGAHAHHRLAQR
ncbi:MAG: hypothetical protein GVY09_03165 [Gammaproteobacteria bacterium]|jgi:hypothetical protein|nr:hypothetical protein [Gammaproteobacteria bacterium]